MDLYDLLDKVPEDVRAEVESMYFSRYKEGWQDGMSEYSGRLIEVQNDLYIELIG